jgi:hypothetical protein
LRGQLKTKDTMDSSSRPKDTMDSSSRPSPSPGQVQGPSSRLKDRVPALRLRTARDGARMPCWTTRAAGGAAPSSNMSSPSKGSYASCGPLCQANIYLVSGLLWSKDEQGRARLQSGDKISIYVRFSSVTLCQGRAGE